MNNIDIRNALKNSKVKYWEVAEALGITDGNFSRKLRKEFAIEEKQKVLKAIDKLKGGEKNE